MSRLYLWVFAASVCCTLCFCRFCKVNFFRMAVRRIPQCWIYTDYLLRYRTKGDIQQREYNCRTRSCKLYRSHAGKQTGVVCVKVWTLNLVFLYWQTYFLFAFKSWNQVNSPLFSYTSNPIQYTAPRCAVVHHRAGITAFTTMLDTTLSWSTLRLKDECKSDEKYI